MQTTVSLAESMAEAVPDLLRRMAGSVPGSVVVSRPGAAVALTGQPDPAFNIVTVTGSSRSDLMQAVRDAERAGVPFFVQSRAPYLPHVEPVLSGLGLVEIERMPGMVSIVAPQPPRPPELALVRVDAPSTIEEFTDTMAVGFEMALEPIRAVMTPALIATPGLAFYVGYVEGRPVTIAASVVHERGVGVFNVTTRPEARGRGYGAAVTARAIAGGFAEGATFAWLQASEAGLPVYRRMGFVEIEEWVLFGRPVPAQRETSD